MSLSEMLTTLYYCFVPHVSVCQVFSLSLSHLVLQLFSLLSVYSPTLAFLSTFFPQEVGNEENDDLDNILEVIDIFKIPKLIYNEDKRKFTLELTRSHNLHGEAADKAALFLHR